MSPRLALLACSLPLVAALARADVLPDGHKGVRHELRLEGLERAPDHVFVLFPMGFRGGAAAVTSDRPLPYIKWTSPRLYAIPSAKAPQPDQVTQAWLDEHATAVSWHVFSQTNVLPEDDPTDRIETLYRIAGVRGKKLLIEGVREERFDRKGRSLSRGVPAVRESDPAKREREDEGDGLEAPRGADRRGSWAPGRLGSGALGWLPALAVLGLGVARWTRRRGAGARGGLIAALAVGGLVLGAGVAWADVPPTSGRADGAPPWAVAALVAGAAAVVLGVVLLRRRGRGAAGGGDGSAGS